jgi:hypothetical protein
VRVGGWPTLSTNQNSSAPSFSLATFERKGGEVAFSNFNFQIPQSKIPRGGPFKPSVGLSGEAILRSPYL